MIRWMVSKLLTFMTGRLESTHGLNQSSKQDMEMEYSWGGVLIFSYLILIHQLEHFGGLYDNQVEPRQLERSEFIGCRFDGPPIAARLYLTDSAKRKRRKPPRSAPDSALGRLQSNSTSMKQDDQSFISI